jgi:hypothetical protein
MFWSVDWTHVEDHVTYHPEIEVMRQQEQIARAEAEIAQANKRPDWSAELRTANAARVFKHDLVQRFDPVADDRADRQDRELAANWQ